MCRRWHLLLLAEGRNNEFIRVTCAAADLPGPSDEHLDLLRGDYFPNGFNSKAKKNASLLEQLGISAFINKSSASEEARGILRRARVREVVEAGAVVGVPADAIAQTVGQHLKEQLTPAAISLYIATFFDVGAVNRSQLKMLVQERVRLSVAQAVSDEADERATRFTIRGDARVVALTLPAAAMAWDAVLLAAGFAPPRRELATAIAQMESVASVRAAQALLRGDADDERRAESFVTVVQKLRQLRETVVSPEKDLEKKMSAFKLRHAEGQTVTLQRLREEGGEVTTEMMPLRDGGEDFDGRMDGGMGS